MSTERRHALILAAAVAACFAAGWGLSIASSRFGAHLDYRAGDAFFRLRFALRGAEPIDPALSIVGLSDDDEEAMGLVGIDRTPFARLVDALSASGAAMVIMDISFPDRGGSPGDGALVASMAAAKNVFLPVILRPDRAVPGSLRRVANFPALEAAAAGIGHINSLADADGIFRRLPMVIASGGVYVPSISLRAACAALGVDPDSIDVDLGDRIRLPGATMPDGGVRDIDIPIDGRGMAVVDFPGPWASSFTYYPFSRIAASLDDPALAEEALSELYGARLVVADLTTSSSDYGPAPFEGVYPLSGLHASMLNSILSDRFVRTPRWYEALGWTVLLAASLWAISIAAKPAAFLAASAAAWLAFGSGQFALFAFGGILPSLAAPSIGAALSLVAVEAYGYLRSERERARLRSRMEQYFAPALVSKILKSPDRFMTAERKVVTVMFSDIAGFTSWCSTRGPDEIHDTLNEYFEMMTEIVFRNEGTVDKFIGDGLMAFFGDPIEQSDHAARAVRTAVQMQRALRESRSRAHGEGGLRMHIRIGINTGEVVVGDMGSRRIMAYTAIGANVNLGSRLESNAPVDGILISESVFRAVNGAFDTRYAGKASAKGLADEFDTWEVAVP